MALDRLAAYLVEQGLLTRRQLEEAQRTQSFFGGELGSHCLKLGFLDEATLARALEAVTGRPYAGRDELLRADPAALGRLSPTLAERLRACPFAFERGTLRVAMLNPAHGASLAEIERAAGCRVEPFVTCEYRLYQALERHYGVRSGPRAISLAPPAPKKPSRTAPVFPPETAPREPEIGLDGRPLDADLSWDDPAFMRPAAAEAWNEPASPAPAVAAASPAESPLDRLGERLAAATSRDEVVHALLDFAALETPRAAVLGASRDGLKVLGTRGRGLEVWRRPGAGPRQDETDLFRRAAASASGLREPVAPTPALRRAFGALGESLPREVALYPIRVRERPAALLYLDAGPAALPPLDSRVLCRACLKAGLAFEILLLRKKLLEL